MHHHLPIVLGNQIDVVKYEARKVSDFRGFCVANVHENGSVEGSLSRLFDHEDLVVELLPLKNGMHVIQKELQVLGSIPKKKTMLVIHFGVF